MTPSARSDISIVKEAVHSQRSDAKHSTLGANIEQASLWEKVKPGTQQYDWVVTTRY